MFQFVFANGFRGGEECQGCGIVLDKNDSRE